MLRLAALIGAGAFALHQLRYLLGYGDRAGDALAGPVHAYLAHLAPLVAGTLAVLLAELIRRCASADRALAPRFGTLWVAASVALVAVYAVQEGAEGVTLEGHGGWVAVPLAIAIGFAVAAAMRGASAASEVAHAPRPWRTPLAAPAKVLTAAAAGLAPRAAAPLHHAARAPPSVAA